MKQKTPLLNCLLPQTLGAGLGSISAGSIALLNLIFMILSCSPSGLRTIPKDLKDSAPLVYGGTPVPPGDFDQVVAILVESVVQTPVLGSGGLPSRASLLCTGTLLRQDVVVTAGHCLHPEMDPSPPPQSPSGPWLPVDQLSGGATTRYWVYQGPGQEGGAFDLDEAIKNGQVRAVTHVRIFPTLWVDILGHGDLGLLKLASGFYLKSQTNFHADPPYSDALLEKAAALVVGYGRREDGGLGVKYQANLSFVRRSGNEGVLGGGGRDSCDGDSGGPLFLSLSDEFSDRAPGKTWGLWGVSSRGTKLECGSGGYYQSLFQGRCWIEESLNSAADLSMASGYQDDPSSWYPDPKTGQCQQNLIGSFPDGDDSTRIVSAQEKLERLCLSRHPESAYRTLRAMNVLEGPQSCHDLVSALLREEEISLEGVGISDLRPLSLMGRLKRVSVRRNNIAKIESLAWLPQLESVDITGNSIVDLEAFKQSWVQNQGGKKLPLIVGTKRQYQDIWNDGFMEYCQDPQLNPGTLKTIQALMARTMSQSCHQAWRRALMTENLILKQRGITDLRPLRDWAHLKSLDLSGNPDLVDIAPLQGLESLRVLKLNGTKVLDLSPLDSLVNEFGLKIVF